MAYQHRFMAGAVAAVMIGLSACSPSPVRETTPTPTATAAHSAVHTAVEEFFATHDPDLYRNRRSVLVSVGDEVVVEDYQKSSPSTPINIQSVGKSIISSLIGIALAEGRLQAVNQTVGELLPASAPVMSPKLKRTTLKQLLTMSAGLPPDDVFFREVFTSPDWVRYIVAHDPGKQGAFEYSSAGSHLLSAILRQATGMLTLQYAKAKLFDPLGMSTTPATDFVVGSDELEVYEKSTNFVWPVDPQGVHVGGGGQKFTARDLLKLGQLWLNDGQLKGRQIIPQKWLKDSRGPLPIRRYPWTRGNQSGATTT
jgi:CubicO group peptidase (beta-lactamase class C family)